MALERPLAAFYADWLHQLGVEDTPAETPTNFYAQKAPAPTIAHLAPKTTATARANPVLSTRPPKIEPANNSQAVATALDAAEAADSLDALKQAQIALPCALKETALNFVFADGDPKASVMFIGEAPGGDEDRQGKPFVGAAGQLLNKMLQAIDLSREAVYVTNLVPWRPPGNRNPLPEERALFRPFVNKHIELVQPKIIVLLGAIAAKEMLDTQEGITKLRGVWQKITLEGATYDALPTFHPAFLLRQPAQHQRARKKLSWEDLQSLQKRIGEI